jgi:hypothetical protein
MLFLMELSGEALGKSSSPEFSGQLGFDSSQKISGSGYTNIHRNFDTNGLRLEISQQGSGLYESDNTADVRQKYVYDDDTNAWKSTSDYEIPFEENNNMAYIPQPFTLGRSFRTKGIEALWSDRFYAKNFGGNVSMNLEFLRLEVMAKEISANLRVSSFSKNDNTVASGLHHATKTNLNAAFFGQGHINVRTTDEAIDEDYHGAFAIIKKMALEGDIKLNQVDDDWMPCCMGGWENMTAHEKMDFGISAEGIFDCSCTNFRKMVLQSL